MTTHPYVEWFSRGEGSRLISNFLENPDMQGFRAIYDDISKRVKQNPDFIPEEFRHYVGSTMSQLFHGDIKELDERRAVRSISILGDLAADITGDERWAAPYKSIKEMERPLEGCLIWYSHLTRKPIPEHLRQSELTTILSEPPEMPE